MAVAFKTYHEPEMPRAWDALVVVATVVSLGVVMFDARFPPGTAESFYLGWADIGLCGLFLIDFAIRLRRASDRVAFVRRNWIDLVSSIPLADAFRAGRVVRVLRLLRMVRTSFVRERIAQRYGVYVSSDAVNGVGFVAVAIWLLTASSFYAFERGENAGIESFGDALWWSMTTLSTVGYGDLYPVSVGGRVVAVITMVLGVGVLGTLAATVATAAIDIRDRGKRGLRRYAMKGHLLVLGWNGKAERALDEFRADVRYRNTPVVVVADRDENPCEIPGVSFVRGNPAHAEALERASAADAAAAIVFASDPTDPRADHETALTVLGVKRVAPDLHVTAELVDARNNEHLIAARCDTVVEGNALASKLLIRSVQDGGVADVVSELLTSKRGAEIHRSPIDARFVGKPYRELALHMLEQRSPILGLARGAQVLVNPELDTTVEAGDEAFAIGQPEPE